jgi:2-polyprenyl-3-methyl-5-hydroxy-6-metoxy-1,4-benzoquinol methylase
MVKGKSVMHEADRISSIKDYYGKILQGKKDLKTSACCCSTDSLPDYQKAILKNIDKEIVEKFYGCGSPIPPSLDGCTVLDLGCGKGRDVYLVSALVGQGGRVIGIDMTDRKTHCGPFPCGSPTVNRQVDGDSSSWVCS